MRLHEVHCTDMYTKWLVVGTLFNVHFNVFFHIKKYKYCTTSVLNIRFDSTEQENTGVPRIKWN